jgi:hypothetical protein
VTGVGDPAIATTDYNRSFQIWSVIEPSTKLEIGVYNVMEGEGEGLAMAIARKMYSLLQSEPKPVP